ncbi:MAG: hypothetical protein ACOC40_02170 [Thermoplasmatota archaeon]
MTGVIPDLRTGMFGNKSYNLVVTNQRLIFAEFNNELMKKDREKAMANAQNSGFFGKMKASIGSSFSFHERYYNMDPETILRESPNNFEMRPEQIQSIKLRSSQYGAEHSGKNINKMKIKWAGGKDKYNFQRVSTGEVKKTLNPLIGSKVR